MAKLLKLPKVDSMAVRRLEPTAGSAESVVLAAVMIWKKKAWFHAPPALFLQPQMQIHLFSITTAVCRPLLIDYLRQW